MDVIKTSGLTKEYDGITAVDSLDLGVAEGEVFGLLGPNGAGKTTLISMLATILEPTSGGAQVCGHDIRDEKNSVRNCIGVVFQDPSLDEKLTGFENLDFHCRLYRIPAGVRKSRMRELLELVELWDKRDNLVETYSGGMKRRLEIARGLLHHPHVLFLDEPTLGLDPQTRRHIWDYITRLNRKEKITIVLTTHYMEEADYLCDRVAIIDHGSIKILDSPRKLKRLLGGTVVSLACTDPEKLGKKLRSMDGVKEYKVHDGTLDLSVADADKRIPHMLETAEKQGVKVSSIHIREPTLEDVFLYYTGRTIREEEGSHLDRMRRMRKYRR